MFGFQTDRRESFKANWEHMYKLTFDAWHDRHDVRADGWRGGDETIETIHCGKKK